MMQKLKLYRTAPYVSGALVAINTIIFLWCHFTGELPGNTVGISPHLFFENGEYYRIIASMFFHADIGHLVNNMLILFGLGAMIEKEVGHVVFAVLYFIAGIGGNIASLAYKVRMGEWYVESIGASGAVFGLVGVLLALVFISDLNLPNVTPARVLFVVAYSIYTGIGNSDIDNAAHIGGAVCGALLGGIWCMFRYFCKKYKSARSGHGERRGN